MKIYVIFTGGTIGSRSENGVISSGNAPYTLIEKYKAGRAAEAIPEFEAFEPYRILSENLRSDNLVTLVKTVSSVLKKGDADGIIITHGTDTIQYTAAMLGHIFADVTLPVLLVSAAYVLDDIRTNGHDNFAGAVRYIEEGKTPGVYISYKNLTESDVRYHKALRMLMPHTYSADMTSLDIDDETADNLSQQIEAAGLALPEINADSFSLSGNTESIVMLRAYPGMAYPSLDGKRAVILEGYHSGTLCIGSDLTDFASEAAGKNIPIYLTGLAHAEAFYETVDAYRALGIIPLLGELPISLYCRLWIIFSSTD